MPLYDWQKFCTFVAASTDINALLLEYKIKVDFDLELLNYFFMFDVTSPDLPKPRHDLIITKTTGILKKELVEYGKGFEQILISFSQLCDLCIDSKYTLVESISKLILEDKYNSFECGFLGELGFATKADPLAMEQKFHKVSQIAKENKLTQFQNILDEVDEMFS
jgi:hypothetical protein